MANGNTIGTDPDMLSAAHAGDERVIGAVTVKTAAQLALMADPGLRGGQIWLEVQRAEGNLGEE